LGSTFSATRLASTSSTCLSLTRGRPGYTRRESSVACRYFVYDSIRDIDADEYSLREKPDSSKINRGGGIK
jgi:hypothetical protein